MLNQEGHCAAILSYADANHYLAGVRDSNGNFYALKNKNGDVLKFNSLCEAESKLKTMGICEAEVVLFTAYDEMVGAEFQPPSCYIAHF